MTVAASIRARTASRRGALLTPVLQCVLDHRVKAAGFNTEHELGVGRVKDIQSPEEIGHFRNLTHELVFARQRIQIVVSQRMQIGKRRAGELSKTGRKITNRDMLGWHMEGSPQPPE